MHQKIFSAIESLIYKGMLANPITLKNYFENEKDELNVPEYLVKITKFSTSSRQAIEYSRIIYDMFVRRELIKISGRADLPGRPLLYATTELFLEHFGITDIEELPNIGELRKVELPDGTEEDSDDEKQEQTSSTQEAETQLALSAVEKPTEETAETSEEAVKGPKAEDSDFSKEK